MLETADRYLIKHQAWLEAVRLCGGVSAYSKQMEVGRSRVSNWINRPDIEIPYEFAITTWVSTQVSIDRLSPFTSTTNQLLRHLHHKRRVFIKFPIKKITIDERQVEIRDSRGQSIIVDTEGVLISGLAKIKRYQASKLKKAPVIVLDLKALLLGIETLSQISTHFLISERVAIGLYLEKCFGTRQGQRNDLKTIYKNLNKEAELRLARDEVTGRTDQKIARLLGFSSKDIYWRAKQVYEHGIQPLVDALNQRKIFITKAAQIAKFPKEEQWNHFQSYLKSRGVKS